MAELTLCSPRTPLPSAITGPGVIPVLRAASSPRYDAVLDTIVETGILAIELTLTTPGVIEAIDDLRTRLDGSGALLGVGTVTDAQTAVRVLDAGAQFLVTPIASEDVVLVARERHIPIIPGAMTPTEIHGMWQAGASAVKVFPAGTVGPAYLDQLRGPFPKLEVIPSGGFSLEDVPSWIRAGAAAISMGSGLVGSALVDEDLPPLRRRCQDLLEHIRHSRS
ncbi:MAG: bifunctional 4-hydroxy-2-oxoglutarate aldolase/2-dehydro-3-deoxy-phosphogluconate aldolase [Nostocoides sp.]